MNKRELVKKRKVSIIPILGKVEDSQFTLGVYEGVERFCIQTGSEFVCGSTGGLGLQYRMDAILTAIDEGSDVIVCIGHRFGDAIAVLESRYPNVCFILIGGYPFDNFGKTVSPCINTWCIDFHEEHAGYLAGYAIVMEGFTSVGFLGGRHDFPGIIRYGYGFAQGVADAACVVGQRTALRYCYTDADSSNPFIKHLAKKWFDDSVQIIFGCGGNLVDSVIDAAESCDGYCIGVDQDQSGKSQRVLTSACKNLNNAVFYVLEKIFRGETGGQMISFSIADDGVYLPISNWRFKNFKREDYCALVEKMKDGMKEVVGDRDENGNQISLEVVARKVSRYIDFSYVRIDNCL